MAAEYLHLPVSTFINQAAGVASGDATFTVSDSSLFTGSYPYRILVDSEIMLLTGVAAEVFSVTRGEEGTTATAHANGAAVSTILTPGALYAVFVAI